MMILRSGKRLISDGEEQNKKKKKKVNDGAKCSYLPEELFFGNILLRLSAKDLAICSCVSKLWYYSILKDPRFASSHFFQNKNRLDLVFNLRNVVDVEADSDWAYFLKLVEEAEKKDKDGNFPLNYTLLSAATYQGATEVVGYCNGFVCTKEMSRRGLLTVINPIRAETFSLTYSPPTSTGGDLCIYLCSGFGFDSISKEYKVVFIYTTNSDSDDQEFVCLVLTLGTLSWRKIVIRPSQISPPPGSSPFPSSMVTTTSRVTPPTLYGDDLAWQVTNTTPSNNNKIDMLLSFDIHNENIHFIRLPTECSPTPTTRDEHHRCLVVDHHLLEIKGYLCVARSEKIMIQTNSLRHDHHHHHHHRLRYRRRHSNGSRRIFCCSGFKVHLFILKDKVNQVWIKGEAFDVQMKEEGLLPAPFCCYFDTTTTATTPPTRMLSFSNKLLLYWFDGQYLLLYNLQLKHLKVVQWSSSCNMRTRDIFDAKLRNGIRPGRYIGDDDNILFPFMDYQLHTQAENMLSLKTFLPDGETRKFNTFYDFKKFIENGGKQPRVMVTANRESVQIHLRY